MPKGSKIIDQAMAVSSYWALNYHNQRLAQSSSFAKKIQDEQKMYTKALTDQREKSIKNHNLLESQYQIMSLTSASNHYENKRQFEKDKIKYLNANPVVIYAKDKLLEDRFRSQQYFLDLKEGEKRTPLVSVSGPYKMEKGGSYVTVAFWSKEPVAVHENALEKYLESEGEKARARNKSTDPSYYYTQSSNNTNPKTKFDSIDPYRNHFALEHDRPSTSSRSVGKKQEQSSKKFPKF